MDPDYLGSGSIGAATGNVDQYFAVDHEPTARIVIDQFMQHIPDPYRSAVEMCIMKRVTYAEAAEWFTIQRGIETDRKTVWRWAQKGVGMMRDMLAHAGWVSAVVSQVPDDE